MKFNCSLSHVLSQLKLANDVVSSRNSVGLFNSILIQADKSHRVTVQSTDTKISFSSVFTAEVQEEGEILVFCGRLMGILGTMKDGDISFRSEDEANLLHIEPLNGQKLKLELRLLSRDRFPHMPEVESDQYFEFAQDSLLNMIRNTHFSVSHDETRHYLNGCYLERSEEALTMVATDAKRLALFKIEDQELPAFESVIIPPKALQFLSKVATGEGNLKIAVTSKRIYFRVDEYDISSVLIEGNFPDYSKILPKECEGRLILSHAEFYDAVNRISIMTEQDTKTTTLTVRGDNTLLLSARGSETGSAEEEIAYEGEPQKEITFGLTSQHLLEPLRQMKNSKVILEYTSSKLAVKLQPDGEERFFHIFMPVSQED